MSRLSLTVVSEAIVASWGPDTMYATREAPSRKPSSPSRGQCGTTAAVLQDWLGGEILAADVYRDDKLVGVHYWNRLVGGEEVDLTADQFLPNEAVVGRREVQRPTNEVLRAHPGYTPYLILKERVAKLLGSGTAATDDPGGAP